MTMTLDSTTTLSLSDLSFCSLFDGQYDTSTSGLFRQAGMKSTYIEQADVIIFNGGADIGTQIYNEYPIYSGIPLQPSRRDLAEMDAFKNAKPNQLLVGICRGSQLLNCLNGGTLWQNVNNHCQDHSMIVVDTDETMIVTSTHHQMMRPNYNTVKIIAVANKATKKDAEGASFPSNSYPDDNQDTEIVWYANTHSLCIQGHPEYVPGSHFANYCLKLILHYANEINHA